MLKVKKITLSGFRGILKPQDLILTEKGDSNPHSLVLYGLNSSGKTSFVDGIEWFLSEENKVEWLTREDAEEKAYPHLAADSKKVESFVELQFNDTDKKLDSLRKTYSHKKITQPTLSSESDFENVYKVFVIKPYLRYLEVIDFVYNHTGLKKYQRLANWMGFESEQAFQEKLALKILPELKRRKEELSNTVETLGSHLSRLTGSSDISEIEILRVSNGILALHKIAEKKNVSELMDYIPEFAKLRAISSVGITVDKLTQAETNISLFAINKTLLESLADAKKKVDDFSKELKKIEQINVIGLYDQALEVLNKQTESATVCPVCGTSWKKDELVKHIQDELGLLTKVKEDKEALELTVSRLKSAVRTEITATERLVSKYDDVQKIIPVLTYEKVKSYKDALSIMESGWLTKPLGSNTEITLTQELRDQSEEEQQQILKTITAEKTKIQPSEKDIKIAEDIEKLTQIRTKLIEVKDAEAEREFTEKEIEKFIAVSNKLVTLIQENIKSRFNEISERIGKYFSILRNDKDIKNIEIVLNEEKGRAAGRSAEIQLHYYDVTVKPAYKVLSESLLNSLGLAVYFTCIKQFNQDCKFIVLDDIMNSLDIDKRDTLLDLIEQEFGDYQVILFTHDYYWFQKILRRFPKWIRKKIKSWGYETGALIDVAATTQGEIEECLADATKIEDAGWKLGRYVESTLNEFCENLWAKVRYRYTKNDPPAMEELFDALCGRLKDKLNEHPVVKQIQEAKKYEPILRNFVSHARTNSGSTVSPQEIKRAAKEWFKLESQLWCNDCSQFVEYHKTKSSIECHCGKLKLEKVK
ncbi:MAG: Uncharacterized protein LiPW30_453 [Parcubacteria group bacterium LiPW_30]|nr:MAG: Uncharacterized protein LiPW30_453 [Parcubacteria group bacterium LiPW_30]